MRLTVIGAGYVGTVAAERMRGRLVIDARNVLSPERVAAAGLRLYGVGR